MQKEETSQGSEATSVRDKALGLFTYLKGLCELRMTQVCTVESYDQVFWLSDIPHDKLCQCVAWSINDIQQASQDQILDVWIEIRKPKLKSPPELRMMSSRGSAKNSCMTHLCLNRSSLPRFRQRYWEVIPRIPIQSCSNH